MAEIVFQFSTSLEWSSMLIRRLCHSPFSHVDVMLEGGRLLGASDNAKAPTFSGNPRGVAIREPDYQRFRVRRRAIVRTPLAQDIVDLGMSQLGKPFDYTATKLRYFLSDKFDDRNWRDPSAWFCAELWAWACDQAGLFPWPLIAVKNRITPADLLMLLNPFIRNASTFHVPCDGIKLPAWES